MRAILANAPPVWRTVVVALLVCLGIGLAGGALVGTFLARAVSALLPHVVG